MAEPLLQIEGLSKRFGGVVAADAITLDLPPGEFHAVIGPNGAGKTTLIGLIAGEVAPQQGQRPLRRHRHHQACRLPPQQARARALVPDHLALFRVHRARQCRACRAGASRPLVSLLARRAPRGRVAPAGAGGARPRRPGATGRRACRRTQPWRAPPARNRDGAGGGAAAPPPRRADGRHGAGGIGPDGGDAPPAQGRA